MEKDAAHLDAAAVKLLLAKLEPLVGANGEVVLIGGQALCFWAERYVELPELRSDAPYTSKDIDFCGRAQHVELCARLLNGTHKLFGPDDLSVCAGVVMTPEGVQLDFVHTPRGVDFDEVLRRAIVFPSLRVMHPIHLLTSKAANVVQIPRNTAPALKQLRASVHIARAFIQEAVSVDVKAARKINEEVFALAKSDDGIAVWRQHGIDVFQATLLHAALGSDFTDTRYPQMCERLKRLRA